MRVSVVAALLISLQVHVVHGFWRMICDKAIVTARIDPITSPGAIAGHTHAITGPSSISYNSSYDDLRASNCSTCQVTQDKSAYWVPQLYYVHQNGTYESVDLITGITTYYLSRGTPGPAGKVLAIPNGLRMLAGDPFRRSYNDSDVAQRAIGYSCLGGNGYTNALSDITNCPNGLRAEIFFPNCWDGVNLDSSDHKSHVVYSGDDGNGACPASHPVKIVSLFFEVMWGIDYWSSSWWNGTAPPFVLAQGDPTGYGNHGDFMSGWDATFLQTAVDTCTNGSGLIQDCPVFDIDYDAAGSCNWDGTLMNDEEVRGAHGGLPALPGCNPVSWGPGEAPAEPAMCPDGSSLVVYSTTSSNSKTTGVHVTSTSSKTRSAQLEDTAYVTPSSQSTTVSSNPIPTPAELADDFPSPSSASSDVDQSTATLYNTRRPMARNSRSSLQSSDMVLATEHVDYVTLTSTVSLASTSYVQIYVVPKNIAETIAATSSQATSQADSEAPVDVTKAHYVTQEMNPDLPSVGAFANITQSEWVTFIAAATPEVIVVTKYVTATMTES